MRHIIKIIFNFDKIIHNYLNIAFEMSEAANSQIQKKILNLKTNDFKPEDYSRFLIREFLKKNGFDQTYESFIKEDTREKVTMTKN